MPGYYPQISPNNTFYLEVDKPHKLYVAEYGNPEGIPVFVIHGGPGGGTKPDYARYFNPEMYRIILLDQRGAGLSTPKACLDGNNTDNLIADIEKIRKHLEIDQVLLFGGSWGSFLSLRYSQAYPENILGLILRGIFLGRASDMTAFLKEGTPATHNSPDEWLRFKAHVFENPAKAYSSEDILNAYYQLISSDDPEVWIPAATAFCRWEIFNSYNTPEAVNKALPWASSEDGMTMGRMELHYFYHECFVKENQLINEITKISGKEIYIVQGKNDTITPPDQASALFTCLEEAGNNVYVDWTVAGHSGEEENNIIALVKATDSFAANILSAQQESSSSSPFWSSQSSQSMSISSQPDDFEFDSSSFGASQG